MLLLSLFEDQEDIEQSEDSETDRYSCDLSFLVVRQVIVVRFFERVKTVE